MSGEKMWRRKRQERKEEFYYPSSYFSSVDSDKSNNICYLANLLVACEQVLRGALAVGRRSAVESFLAANLFVVNTITAVNFSAADEM